MTMSATDALLRARWASVARYDGAFLLIDNLHPLSWHVGLDRGLRKTLLLVTPYQPAQVPASRSIDTQVGQRADQRWALSFRLVRTEHEEVFVHLCGDLVESSSGQPDTLEGLAFVLKRYKQWARLLERQDKGLMSDERRRGLIGELSYLEQLIVTGTPPLDAVRGWVGPEGADQDFVYELGWREIKTIGASGTSITVSSLEQLGAVTPGQLIVYRIDHTSPGDLSGFTLRQKVDGLRSMIACDHDASELFDIRLLQYGYVDLPEYGDQHYRLGTSNQYSVEEGFPRLVREDTPAPITNLSYTISLPSIVPWLIRD